MLLKNNPLAPFTKGDFLKSPLEKGDFLKSPLEKGDFLKSPLEKGDSGGCLVCDDTTLKFHN